MASFSHNDFDYAKVPLTEDKESSTKQSNSEHWSVYPADRRCPATTRPPKSTMFIKTGGNALQAVDTLTLPDHVISVVVPWGHNPGDEIWVTAPDGRIFSTTIPPGAFYGHAFLVEVPPPSETVVVGIPVHDHTLAEEQVVAAQEILAQRKHDLDLDVECTAEATAAAAPESTKPN